MSSKKLLNIDYHPQDKKYILEEIIMSINKKNVFKHVVSLNPENIIVAQSDAQFRKVLSESDYQIIDGVGVLLAERLLGKKSTVRITGVDLSTSILNLCYRMSLSIGFIGGKGNLAEELANCYQKIYPNSRFFGTRGYINKSAPGKNEERDLFMRVTANKPQIVFVAFGSPFQEKWIWRNRDRFKGVVCIGVGGAFDFLSGKVPRAPGVIRRFGLEWLFRLVVQPWRIGRQFRLIQFIFLLIKERIKLKNN